MPMYDMSPSTLYSYLVRRVVLYEYRLGRRIAASGFLLCFCRNSVYSEVYLRRKVGGVGVFGVCTGGLFRVW